MALPPAGKPRELPPEAQHQAILYGLVDVGTQQPNNPNFSANRKIYFLFELVGPGLKNSEGNPFFMLKEYTFTAKSKNLLKDIKMWRNIKDKDLSKFDVDTLLGLQATLDVRYNDDNTYANIMLILPQQGKNLKATSALFSFYLDDWDGDIEADEFKKQIPAWLQTKIAASEEYPDIAKKRIEAKKNGGAKAQTAAKKGKK